MDGTLEKDKADRCQAEGWGDWDFRGFNRNFGVDNILLPELR